MGHAYAFVPLIGPVALVAVAFVIGVARRRSGLRLAQALAPDSFVFRFSMWGDFGTQLPRLPESTLAVQRSGKRRVGSVSCSRDGLAIWQVDGGTQLANVPWHAVTNISESTTVADVGLSSRWYPTLLIEVANIPSATVVPFLSANSRFFWPRTSVREVGRIVEELTRQRATYLQARAG